MNLFSKLRKAATNVNDIPHNSAFKEECRQEHARGDSKPLAAVIQDLKERTLLDELIAQVREFQRRNAERLVRELAYFLWEDAGRPDGRDLEFWFAAERKYLDSLKHWLKTGRTVCPTP